MIIHRLVSILFIYLLSGLPLVSQQNAFLKKNNLPYVEGEIIVGFEDEQQKIIFLETLKAQNRSDKGAFIKKELFRDRLIYLVEISGSENEDFWIGKLKSEGLVKMAGKNYLIEDRSVRPDDIDYADQYYLETIGAPSVWRYTTGGKTALGDTIVVAILDSGFKPDHADLEPNRFYNRHEIPGNGIDDDGNGYIDDYSGWNNLTQSGELAHSAHGTSVAGIIGAKGNNQIGVSGVNWDVKLMMVSGVRNAGDVISGYHYVYTMRKLYNETNGTKGAYIVASNASFGIRHVFPQDEDIFRTWCEMYDILGEIGVLSVGATTNVNEDVGIVGDLPSTCTSPYLIIVTSCGEYDGLGVSPTGFSKDFVHVASPGERLWTTSSTSSENRYGNFGGTSGATPVVTGVVALLASLPLEKFASYSKENPGEGVLKLRELILSSVKPLAAFEERITTGGRIDLEETFKRIAIEYGFLISDNFRFTELYPNPCCGENGILNFRFESFDLESNTLEIYDLSGRRIFQTTFSPLTFSEVPYIDLNALNLPVGAGFILVMQRGKRKDARVFFRLK